MAKNDPFGPVVEARTRAAVTILNNKEMKDAFLTKGGLETDLVAIRDAGLRAVAANLGQSTNAAAGVSATAEVLAAFEALEREYAAVMAVVQAVEGDLERAQAPAEVVGALAKILANETAVRLTPANGEGAAKRRARRSSSMEAVRAEIEKDAQALVELTSAHAALEARRVGGARLEALARAARALSGKLGERAAKKGAAKAATAAEREAVAQQKAVWSSCHRLLAAVGDEDPRVRALLDGAAVK